MQGWPGHVASESPFLYHLAADEWFLVRKYRRRDVPCKVRLVHVTHGLPLSYLVSKTPFLAALHQRLMRVHS